MPPPVGRVLVTCLHCGDKFGALASRIAIGGGKYCSAHCQREASKKRIALTCETCGKAFELPACRVGTRFCSRKCKRFQPRESNAERLARFVVIPDDPDACWGWCGSTLPFGYGQIRDSDLRRQIPAHIMSYRLHVGPIPKGKFVLHKCDNPPCANPKHLFLGTKKQNSEDMVAKRRNKYGVIHFNAKLTDADIIEIRHLVVSGAKMVDLAGRFGVSPATIQDAVARRTWKHI